MLACILILARPVFQLCLQECDLQQTAESQHKITNTDTTHARWRETKFVPFGSLCKHLFIPTALWPSVQSSNAKP